MVILPLNDIKTLKTSTIHFISDLNRGRREKRLKKHTVREKKKKARVFNDFPKNRSSELRYYRIFGILTPLATVTTQFLSFLMKFEIWVWVKLIIVEGNG